LVAQSNSVAANRVFEGDNNKSPNNASPESNGKVSNITIISGNALNKDLGSPDSIKSRRGNNLTYANLVMDKNYGTCFDATDGSGSGNLNTPLNSVLADCAPMQANVPVMGFAGLIALMGSLTLVARRTKKVA